MTLIPVPERTATVLIDLMPRILGQSLAPHAGTDVLAACRRLADATRAAGGLVVWVRVERPGVADQPPGSELADGGRQPEDLVVVKRTWGAFTGTGLDERLRERGVDTIVLAGVATNFGVEQTGRWADEIGYRVVFVHDAISGLHEHAHRFAVEYVFPALGEVVDTGVAIAAFGSP